MCGFPEGKPVLAVYFLKDQSIEIPLGGYRIIIIFVLGTIGLFLFNNRLLQLQAWEQPFAATPHFVAELVDTTRCPVQTDIHA